MKLDRLAMIKLLFKYGWSAHQSIEDAVAKTSDGQLSLLQKLYAAFHGLSSAADVEDSLKQIRFCNLPDVMPVTQGNLCKWADPTITWDVTAFPTTLAGGKDKFVACIAEAFARWAKVCGIRPVYSPGNPSVKITVGTRLIDGKFGVLAESELPCGNVQQCRQWYDTGDQWKAFDGGPASPNDLDIVRVATHELGHALGMNHIGTGNLLAPIYSNTVWTPQNGDIQEMQARYGPPLAAPTVPIPPTSGENYVMRFTDGKLAVDGYRLTKLAS